MKMVMDGLMIGRTHERTDGQKGQTNECMDGQTDGWTDGRTDGRTRWDFSIDKTELNFRNYISLLYHRKTQHT